MGGKVLVVTHPCGSVSPVYKCEPGPENDMQHVNSKARSGAALLVTACSLLVGRDAARRASRGAGPEGDEGSEEGRQVR